MLQTFERLEPNDGRGWPTPKPKPKPRDPDDKIIV